MSRFQEIRKLLGMSQADIAKALGCGQPNVSHYERRDQTVPPDIARKLVALARQCGVPLRFDHIYGDDKLPTQRVGVHTFAAIRQLLGISQPAMARALDMSVSNVSFLERGQTVTPDVAAKLIQLAAALGVQLSYDQIYGAAELPRLPGEKGA